MLIVRLKNGSNTCKVVIELRVVQFWSEIILVISNHAYNFTRMISDHIALHSVQLPLFSKLPEVAM